MGSVEEFNKAWNYIWQIGNELVENDPYVAVRDKYDSTKLHQEMTKMKAAFDDAQEEWWKQHNAKRKEMEEAT